MIFNEVYCPVCVYTRYPLHCDCSQCMHSVTVQIGISVLRNDILFNSPFSYQLYSVMGTPERGEGGKKGRGPANVMCKLYETHDDQVIDMHIQGKGQIVYTDVNCRGMYGRVGLADLDGVCQLCVELMMVR